MWHLALDNKWQTGPFHITIPSFSSSAVNMMIQRVKYWCLPIFYIYIYTHTHTHTHIMLRTETKENHKECSSGRMTVLYSEMWLQDLLNMKYANCQFNYNIGCKSIPLTKKLGTHMHNKFHTYKLGEKTHNIFFLYESSPCLNNAVSLVL
jgi:hypothetical protein